MSLVKKNVLSNIEYLDGVQLSHADCTKGIDNSAVSDMDCVDGKGERAVYGLCLNLGIVHRICVCIHFPELIDSTRREGERTSHFDRKVSYSKA